MSTRIRKVKLHYFHKTNKHLGKFIVLGYATDVDGLDRAKANLVVQSEQGHLMVITERQFNERFIPAGRGAKANRNISHIDSFKPVDSSQASSS